MRVSTSDWCTKSSVVVNTLLQRLVITWFICEYVLCCATVWVGAVCSFSVCSFNTLSLQLCGSLFVLLVCYLYTVPPSNLDYSLIMFFFGCRYLMVSFLKLTKQRWTCCTGLSPMLPTGIYKISTTLIIIMVHYLHHGFLIFANGLQVPQFEEC